MKSRQIELGLISLDRLALLKDRVILSSTEYLTLLNSLEMAFSTDNLELIDRLNTLEQTILKTLIQRIKIFKAHIQYLKARGKNSTVAINYIETEVYTKIDLLNSKLDEFRTKLTVDQVNLKDEITTVGRIVKPMGQGRDYTGRRIDIIT